MSKPKAIGAALSLMMLTAILTGCTSGDNLGKIEKDLSNGGWIYFTNDTIDHPEAMGYLTFSSDGSLLIGEYISEEECIEHDDVSYWVQSEEVCYIDNNELAKYQNVEVYCPLCSDSRIKNQDITASEIV